MRRLSTLATDSTSFLREKKAFLLQRFALCCTRCHSPIILLQHSKG